MRVHRRRSTYLDKRMRQGQEIETFRTRSFRIVTNEAGKRFKRHSSLGNLVRRAVTYIYVYLGELCGNVSRLWCKGRQHAVRRAGKPIPAVSPRDLPLLEADIRPSVVRPVTPTGTYVWAPLSRGDASKSNFRHETYFSNVIYADLRVRVHVPTGNVIKMDKLLSLLRRESATTTPALGMFPLPSTAINLSLDR